MRPLHVWDQKVRVCANLFNYIILMLYTARKNVPEPDLKSVEENEATPRQKPKGPSLC